MWGSTVGAWKPSELQGVWLRTGGSGPPGGSPGGLGEVKGRSELGEGSQLVEGIEGKRSGAGVGRVIRRVTCGRSGWSAQEEGSAEGPWNPSRGGLAGSCRDVQEESASSGVALKMLQEKGELKKLLILSLAFWGAGGGLTEGDIS